jgi:hypothetical protein
MLNEGTREIEVVFLNGLLVPENVPNISMA